MHVWPRLLLALSIPLAMAGGQWGPEGRDEGLLTLAKVVTVLVPAKVAGPELEGYRRAAEHGEAAAQTLLGSMYFLGEGLPADLHAALGWYRKAAEQGHAWAQNSVGCAYNKGQGVPQDFAQAVIWFRKAAEHGECNAQFNLGESYYYGRGVPQDDEQAEIWYCKAAEQGDADAQLILARMREEGRNECLRQSPTAHGQPARSRPNTFLSERQ